MKEAVEKEIIELLETTTEEDKQRLLLILQWENAKQQGNKAS